MKNTPTVASRPDGGEANGAFEQQLREMNEALLISSVNQHELADQARQAEAALRESEERYRTLFEVVPIAVYCCDAAGVIQQFNHHAAELWGRQPAPGDTDERFCGSFKMFRPNGGFMPHEKCPMAEVVSGKISEVHDAEVLIERPDGSRVTVVVNIRPLKKHGGEIIGAINCFYDISDRKRAEVAVQNSEVRYRRLFEAAHHGILIVDISTRRITDVNAFVLDLLDFPREYFIGKELWEIGVFRDRGASQTALQELYEKGPIRFEDQSLPDRNGRRHPVEIVANIYQEDLYPVIQCNIRDISERKRFEDEREAHLHNEQLLRLEAETANCAKDMFLATLSHELRTPLSAIVGWVSVLRDKDHDENDLQEGLQAIERNTKSQLQLIEDVLDVSRMVSGKLRLEMRPCELIDVINAGVEVVRATAEARDITLNVQLDPSASRASCDPGRIQQVVWNLLSNAIKFTPKGGTVSLTLVREKSSLRIGVSDSGQGIGPELLPYIFDRFRQGDSNTRRRSGGLGLGLSIVKQIVEMHGGTVEARSGGEGRGSTFTVFLPIRAVRVGESHEEERASGAADASSLPPVALDGLRLLVVDDEADARRLLVRVLQAAGAIVMPAASAAEALESLSKAKPDLLVSDLGMPEQDGLDLIREVRRRGHHAKDLPAVALTAFAHKNDERQALLAGFQVHVPKPVDAHDLTVVIASLAGRTC